MLKQFLIFLIPSVIILSFFIFKNKARFKQLLVEIKAIGALKEQRADNISAIDLLFKNASKEFSQYRVIKKNGSVLICELDSMRNETKELVFININPLAQKSIQQNNAFIVAMYRRVPTGLEMRFDFAGVLK